MEKRHEAQFLARLDRILTIGVTEIHREEIKLWFGQTRVARRTWRQIADYWKELVDDEAEEKLIIAGLDTDIWIFSWGKGQPTTEDSYYLDVRYLAGRTLPDGKPLLGQAEADDED
ncbi:hypothetical protein [Rhizobium laguerreae]|uniref:hypothetical protein n=1 Tax=Rhizobium laguerreae TaxID=1076926 RepID=UPI001C922486|nr:hypothetical protein [Rhizobium laguerreae]MBY3231827.1 hypothetical protein [Rhizobium laguerreae]